MAKRKILIVEDEFMLYLFLRKVLERKGYEVCDIITTGENVITNVEKEKPDAIIMDINLNGQMDGIEAGIKIKNRFGIPVIYVTGYSENEVMEKSKESEPIGYLVKPIDVEELLSLIESIPQNN